MSRRLLSRFKRRRTMPRLYVMALVLLLLLISAAYGYYRFDRRILPVALTFAEQRLTTRINNAIHTEVQEFATGRNINASDFYIQTLDPNGNGNVLAVNTVLVNDLCNTFALSISERLSAMPSEPVSVPMGMALGLDTLANVGPRFTFNIAPTGNALVDYESKFESVGINQVHFEVWLNIVSTIRVVSPTQTAMVTVTREVSLVDTVISGVVPDTYLTVDGRATP